MGASAFTPGPWLAEESPVTPDFWCVSHEGGDVTYVTLGGIRKEANAHLIASAPRLYAALEAILPCAFDGPQYDEAVAALAEARGETA